MGGGRLAGRPRSVGDTNTLINSSLTNSRNKLTVTLYFCRYLSDDKPDTSPDGVKRIKKNNTQDKDIAKKSSVNISSFLDLLTTSRYLVGLGPRVCLSVRCVRLSGNYYPTSNV